MNTTSAKTDLLCVDIGSTNIKCVRFSETSEPIEHRVQPRDLQRTINEQVTELLNDSLKWDPSGEALRICSSANGGVRVGIMAYTERFSGEALSRGTTLAGGNVCYRVFGPEIAGRGYPKVDVLMIGGGVDGVSSKRLSDWLERIRQIAPPHDVVAFAGNRIYFDSVRRLWDNALCIDNILDVNLSWRLRPLQEALHRVYLDDLISKDGVSALQPLSEVAIWPTPAVVQLAHRTILEQQSNLVLMAPLLLLDIGGATTDIYYGGEFITSHDDVRTVPVYNRHVFAELGMFASQRSTCETLRMHERLTAFLQVIVPDEVEARYSDLHDGQWDWMTPAHLAYACFFLVMDAAVSGHTAMGRLHLERTATIAITGGGAQVCDPEILQRLFSTNCRTCFPRVILDADYMLWTEGMRRISTGTKSECTKSQ